MLKVLFKGSFEGEHPEIALTTYLGKQVSYRKELKDYLGTVV